jgi:hypothetical protein
MRAARCWQSLEQATPHDQARFNGLARPDFIRDKEIPRGSRSAFRTGSS